MTETGKLATITVCSMGISIRVGAQVFAAVRPEDAGEFFQAHVLPAVAAGARP